MNMEVIEDDLISMISCFYNRTSTPNSDLAPRKFRPRRGDTKQVTRPVIIRPTYLYIRFQVILSNTYSHNERTQGTDRKRKKS